MNWYELIMYILVGLLTIMRILEFFGVSFKIQFAVVSIEVEKLNDERYFLKLFPIRKKDLTLMNYLISNNKRNNLTDSNTAMGLVKNSSLSLINKCSSDSKAYLHILFRKPNGKRVKKTRNISKILKNDVNKLRLKRIKIKV